MRFNSNISSQCRAASVCLHIIQAPTQLPRSIKIALWPSISLSARQRHSFDASFYDGLFCSLPLFSFFPNSFIFRVPVLCSHHTMANWKIRNDRPVAIATHNIYICSKNDNNNNNIRSYFTCLPPNAHPYLYIHLFYPYVCRMNIEDRICIKSLIDDTQFPHSLCPHRLTMASATSRKVRDEEYDKKSNKILMHIKKNLQQNKRGASEQEQRQYLSSSARSRWQATMAHDLI